METAARKKEKEIQPVQSSVGLFCCVGILSSIFLCEICFAKRLSPAVCFSLLSEILKETSEDIEEIEYLTDGSWRPIRDEKERDRERERSNTPEYPVVDICKYECMSLYAVVLSVCVGGFFFFLF